MAKQTIEIEVPEGYEATGYGYPEEGWLVLADNLGPFVYRKTLCEHRKYIILRKVEPHDWGVEWKRKRIVTVDGSGMMEAWSPDTELHCFGDGVWDSKCSSSIFQVGRSALAELGINIPPYDDWRKAKWEVGGDV